MKILTARQRAIARYLGKQLPKNRSMKTITPQAAAKYLERITAVVRQEGRWYDNYINLKIKHDDLEVYYAELKTENNKLKLELLEIKGSNL